MNRNLETLLRWGIENSDRPEELVSSAAASAGLSSSSRSSGPSSSSSNAVTLPASGEPDTVAEEISSSAVAAASSSSTGGNGNPAQRSTAFGPGGKLDPAILDAIMGKSDAQRMKECVRDLQSEEFSHEQKMYIWDELELLVESLDNANDLESLQLWQPIFAFLSDADSDMRIQACWVLGTAVQNNPRSQAAFLALDPLPTLLDLLRTATSGELRSKAMYALSGLLRHHPPAVVRFSALDGWAALAGSLADPSLALRRKTAFLVSTLFMNVLVQKEGEAYLQACQNARLVDSLLDSLDEKTALPTGPDGEETELDDDYTEKALGALVIMVQQAGTAKFTSEQMEKLRAIASSAQKEDKIPADLAKSEWQSFTEAIAA